MTASLILGQARLAKDFRNLIHPGRTQQTPPRHPLRQCIIKLTGYSREISSLGSPPLLPYARPMYYIV